MMPPPEHPARSPADFYLDVARKLLAGRDLVGCRRFALQAMDADPVYDGVDQLLAIADVLLASEKRINNHLDWYAVLRLEPAPTSAAAPLDVLRRKFRRLALLLDPSKNSDAGADAAYKLVLYAWSVLSDPVKRGLFDKERDIALGLPSTKPAVPTPPPPPEVQPVSFWTGCPTCYNIYEYPRVYQGGNLRCQGCRKGFKANELKAMPEIIPGADAYYFNYGIPAPVGASPRSPAPANRSPAATATPVSMVNPFAANIPLAHAVPVAVAKATPAADGAEGFRRTKAKSGRGTTAARKAAVATAVLSSPSVEGFHGNMMETDISDVLGSYPRIYDNNGNEMVMDLNDFV